MSDETIRRRIRVGGIVQGVGFRPFVYRQATSLGLVGWVLNDVDGVLLEAQGGIDFITRLIESLQSDQPPLARVDHIQAEEAEVRTDETAFNIVASDRIGTTPHTIAPTDSHVCDECVRETFDPAARRYRYPFTNCTNCGPRYSIIRRLPYDRSATTMAPFEMCPDCGNEYRDPADRRYHAQPIACPLCGPALMLHDPRGPISGSDDALVCATKALADGAIVAVKSTGGFHLSVDATNPDAISELRRRKRRDAKPFAIMVPNLTAARQVVETSPVEEALLTSPARPIVLLRRRTAALPESVAPRNPNLGVMLPSSPLHHLLFPETGPNALVMTSGNVSGHPIAYRNDQALEQLFAIADLVLLHNREIQTRVDDSVLRISLDPRLDEDIVTFFRRSRGYAPEPIAVNRTLPPSIALGAELKTTVAAGRDGSVYLSQHIGDLKNDEVFESHRRAADHLCTLYDLAPQLTAVDLHPSFRSTRLAKRSGTGSVELVQHHHAHMASCMAENNVEGPALGVIFDGAGYGLDSTIWGGEFLVGGFVNVERVARLRTIRLLGGDKAVAEPLRTGYAVALDTFDDSATASTAFPALRSLSEQERQVYAVMARNGVQSPATSSMGRLFDAVAALLGLCTHAEYEAQGPIEMEGLLARDLQPAEKSYEFGLDNSGHHLEIDFRPVIAEIATDLRCGIATTTISRRFHTAVVMMITRVAHSVRSSTGIETVVLSGGVFLNEFLLVNTLVALRDAGFDVRCHRRVPPNDGGIALGQIMIATARQASS